MPALNFEDFASRHYAVLTYPLYGCCRLVRKADKARTLLLTGSEGLEDYRALKRAWRRSRALFEGLCAEYDFEPID